MADAQSPPPGSEPLFAGVQRESARLAGDVRGAVGKRWELAQLELTIAAWQVKRLSIWLAGALWAALTLLPLVIVLIADGLGAVTVWSRTIWLGLFVLLLALGIPAGVWYAWTRFRREFVGLEATLAELREDLRWLEEHLPQYDSSS
ncbi:MAG: phage holin family protein [Planctomycetaceae bacterium]|nr:phage holin family protein [Planctomycetaceae bacterium]